MRTVRDESGRRYLLVKESAESSLVRDPETGERRYLERERLRAVEGESPLETAAGAIPEPVRRVLTAIRDERILGLLVELDDRGPLSIREILGEYDLCESDVHGATAELQVAGLLAETTVAGERGYKLTDDGEAALAHLRG